MPVPQGNRINNLAGYRSQRNVQAMRKRRLHGPRVEPVPNVSLKPQG